MGIVTCGGLCPGLNNVIRELVHALVHLYDVDKIFGIRGGFNGFLGIKGYEPIILTVDNVADCHHQGNVIKLHNLISLQNSHSKYNL